MLDGMDALRFGTEAFPLVKWLHERGMAQAKEGTPSYAER